MSGILFISLLYYTHQIYHNHLICLNRNKYSNFRLYTLLKRYLINYVPILIKRIFSCYYKFNAYTRRLLDGMNGKTFIIIKLNCFFWSMTWEAAHLIYFSLFKILLFIPNSDFVSWVKLNIRRNLIKNFNLLSALPN